MVHVLKNSWALLLGMLLLMIGNGLQGSLLGVRGAAAGFSAGTMSIVMAGYFAGFLLASRTVPGMIRRVGHVRVFAALGSFVSAVLILFPAVQDPIAWTLGRLVLGFCFCGVYVTAESWLNNAADNETRGQTLSAYMIVQMAGIIVSQALLVIPDVSGFLLFVIPSVLVSISFAPILLSISPTPAFESSKPMTLRELYGVSPLGMVGMFLLGGVFAAQFGMAAVYATEVGLKLTQISIFVASFYVGALVLQYPLGWVSDRVDRRWLIMLVAACGAGAAVLATVSGGSFAVLVAAAFVIGGCSNPLYSLLIAYTNDFLNHEDMASASAGLLFVNGLGAIAGPLIIGWVMERAGPQGFFLLIFTLLALVSLYALYRMTQRAAPSVEDTGAYAPVMPSSTPVALEVAQEYFIDQQEEDEADAQ
ncbi:MFS transporter [Mameliella alba]|uniref:Major facilitator transporter n=2 Tax=Mameliella TaxID=1434019 RepID=A0A0B3SP14_9RHOB|nr:MFS transporter [Mameliella alba]MBV6634686.1 MFS transporter [Mameliella sp.]ODM49245.1 MFS transporter [Ruegeria sp. PBVC088]KHQ52174.1 Major facilitator transporter [Mameliella alba]MBY6120025.1 MFS transporter [Mameliella alba]OWV45883.1 MFS transporter [Mameliella alba]